MIQPNFVLVNDPDTIQYNHQLTILKNKLNDKRKSRLRNQGSLRAASGFVRSNYGKE